MMFLEDFFSEHMVSFLMDERHFSLLCIVVEDNGDYIKALVPFLSEHLHHMKSENLQFNTLGRWVERLIDQAYDVPS